MQALRETQRHDAGAHKHTEVGTCKSTELRNWQFYFNNRLPLHLEPVNTACSTMDLIRANLWLSDHTITFLSILCFSNSQRSGRKRREKRSENPPAVAHHTGMENAVSKPSVTTKTLIISHYFLTRKQILLFDRQA